VISIDYWLRVPFHLVQAVQARKPRLTGAANLSLD
jgi:hypothetical protein